MSRAIHEIKGQYERDLRDTDRQFWVTIGAVFMAWSSGFVAGLLVAGYFLSK